MRMLVLQSLLFFLGSILFAAKAGDSPSSQKYVGVENDPVFQALAALNNPAFEEEFLKALEAVYASRFDEANRRIAALQKKHSEAALGDTLSTFLLLMQGASLGFSGEYDRSMEVLDTLIARLGDGDDDEKTADDLAGVMDLKIDILEAKGDRAAVLEAMEDLIRRFGESKYHVVRWRIERAMQRKEALLKEPDSHE